MDHDSIIHLGLAVAYFSGTVASAGPTDIDFGQHTYRELQIESDPTGALIWIDGRPFGSTPQAIRVDNERQTIRVILNKPGYLETGADVDLTEPVTVIHAALMPMQQLRSESAPMASKIVTMGDAAIFRKAIVVGLAMASLSGTVACAGEGLGNFKDDKIAFIDQFMKNTYFQSIIDLIQSLPVDQQEEVKEQLKLATNSEEKIDQTLNKYFTQDQRSKALEEASKNAMIGDFKAIDTTLSTTQKQCPGHSSQQVNAVRRCGKRPALVWAGRDHNQWVFS